MKGPSRAKPGSPARQSTRGADATPLASGVLFILHSLVPVNADVTGLPADGDDVRSAIAIEVGDRQGFHSHAAVFDYVPSPFSAVFVYDFIDADAATFAWLIAEIVANAD